MPASAYVPAAAKASYLQNARGSGEIFRGGNIKQGSSKARVFPQKAVHRVKVESHSTHGERACKSGNH